MTPAFLMARKFLELPFHVRYKIVLDLKLMTGAEFQAGTSHDADILAFRRAAELGKVEQFRSAIYAQ